MRTSITSLSLLTILCLVLAIAPAMADTLYDNGPVNGTTDAWTINFGFAVSDTFTCCNGSPGFSIEGVQMGVWLLPGDRVQSVDMAIGEDFFGTDISPFQTLSNPSVEDLGINQYGYDIQIIGFTFPNIHIPCCLTTITFQNAVEGNFGDPIYWDENSGPSEAMENQLGTIPSEAFTLTGTPEGGTTPEPSSIMLFASGILGLAGVLRRKLL